LGKKADDGVDIATLGNRGVLGIADAMKDDSLERSPLRPLRHPRSMIAAIHKGARPARLIRS
jgi:hypothetical protein